MKKLSAVIKGELKRYFASPVAVVYLIAFLLLNRFALSLLLPLKALANSSIAEL